MLKPEQLVVRCLAFKEEGQWIGVCLNFNLAAQADSFPEVRERLDAQIRSYLRDALVGDDRWHAGYLLRRRAPLRYRLMYWAALLAHRLHLRTRACDYESSLPLVPA